MATTALSQKSGLMPSVVRPPSIAIARAAMMGAKSRGIDAMVSQNCIPVVLSELFRQAPQTIGQTLLVINMATDEVMYAKAVSCQSWARPKIEEPTAKKIMATRDIFVMPCLLAR